MSEQVKMMTVGGGNKRALVDHLFRYNEVQSTPAFVTAKTASYTILSSEFGCAFSNSGASGSVTFTLPTPEAGALLFIIKATTNQNVVISGTVPGGTTITNSTSEHGSIILVGLSDSSWAILGQRGTWAIS